MLTLTPSVTRPLQLSCILCLLAVCISLTSLAQPTISSFAPASGPVGTAVTIIGTNFSPTPSNNIVTIGAVRANVTAATTTTLTVTIPAGTTYQPISVTTNGFTAYTSKPFIVTFSGAASQFTAQSFEYDGKVDSVDSSIETTKYTIGDIDVDGLVDVITVDGLNNTMSVYRNTSASGSITFATNINFTTGPGPRSVTAADIDSDGLPEVMVTNFNANTISVFRNTTSSGIISFAPKLDFGTATQPAGISVADIDKDGKPDLVINSINVEGYVSILRNTGSAGTISFAPKIDIQAVGGSIEEIRTADIDGDGKTDIALPNFNLNRITIFRNTSSPGSVSFASKIDLIAGGSPDRLEIGDFNDDGKPDLAATYYLTGTIVSVFRNTSIPGSIFFNNSIDYPTGFTTDGLTINDFDGDGKPDLAVCSGADSVALFKNSSPPGGTISFDAASRFAAPWNSPLLSGDFDNDGKPDLSFKSGIFRVTVWKNNTTSPQIISFSPNAAGTGSTVTIHGVNFTGVTSVSFGGVAAASFTVEDDRTITAVVGNGTSGSATITAPHGVSSLEGFTYVPAPVITSFTPGTGITGQTITISGSNFSGATSVSFGGMPAAGFTVVNSNTITAVVGSGASGDVSVTTISGTATLAGFTYIPPPDIISFTPASGNIGAMITITGTNFTGATEVRFGGVPAASFTVVSPTTITAVVLDGESGFVKVTTPGGSDSLAGFIFIPPPPPVITAVSPAKGPAGTVITISGNNFHTDPAFNYVYFGPARATVTVASANSLTVQVPPGAAYGQVSVTANFLTAFSPYPFVPTFAGGGDISSGSFSEYSTFVTDASPNDVCISDFDGDGKNDLATANNSFSISVLRNNSVPGNILFEPKVDYPGSSFMCIESTDINGDGKKDIVAMSSDPDRLSIYENASTPGNINLANRVDNSLDAFPMNFTTGDIDRDGKPDIVIANFTSISIFRNTSTKHKVSLAPRTDIQIGFFNTAVKVADVDGDGQPDIALLSAEKDSVLILRNTSVGSTLTFAPPLSFASAAGIPGSQGSSDLCISDLDDDGKPEIAITNNSSSISLSVLKNNSTPGSVSFLGEKDLMTGNSWPGVIVAEDLDGDGKPDYAFTHHYVPRTVCVIKNNSTADSLSFASHLEYTDGSNHEMPGLCTGDLDNDGRPEIIAAGGATDPGIVYVFKNKTNGPHITSFSPGNGIAGTVITITGSNFTGATSVSFGGVPAASFTVVSPDTITAVVATGASGDVNITTPLGSSWLPGFLYGLLPTITSFTPTSGATGASVTIKGTNLSMVTEVRFGGKSASFTINSDTVITATVGNGASGSVSVTGPGGTTSMAGFTYIPPPPVITSFAPQSGTTGTEISFWGSDFSSATHVSFGGVPAQSFAVRSSSVMTAIVGPGATGSVIITTAGGSDTVAGFTYLPPPVITSFTPVAAGAGTVVTITGNHFTGATAVNFGGVAASSFTVTSPTSITAVVANGASGSVYVITLVDTAILAGFTFIPAPTITSFTPDTAETGATVTITGTNFTGATSVSFGGVAASSLVVNSATSITAVIGSGASGAVTVVTPGGMASHDGFTYRSVTGLVDPSNANSKYLTANPNPSHGIIVINHPVSVKNVTLRFIDVLGREVKTIIPARNTTKTVTNVKSLVPGMYTIIWSDGIRNLSRVIAVQ